MDIKIRYAPYCTCFTDTRDGETTACFYNEMSDAFIKRIKCETPQEAEEIKKEWVRNAPKNVICQKID